MQPVDAEGTFDALYGLETAELTSDGGLARVLVRGELLQPAGLVHGGVYASIAEALATMATYEGIAPGSVAVGLSNHTSFLRPVTAGALNARALPRHRGRTTCVWDIEISDEAGRLAAVSRMTVAVRPARRDGGGDSEAVRAAPIGPLNGS